MPFDGTNFEWDDDVLRRLRIGREKIVAGWSQTTIWSDQGSVCAIGAVLAPENILLFGVPRYWRFWTDGAVWALRHALPNGRRSIVFFNDHRRTTKSDVLQLFDRAIEARIAKLARFSVSSGKSADFVECLLALPVDVGRPIATGGATPVPFSACAHFTETAVSVIPRLFGQLIAKHFAPLDLVGRFQRVTACRQTCVRPSRLPPLGARDRHQ